MPTLDSFTFCGASLYCRLLKFGNFSTNRTGQDRTAKPALDSKEHVSIKFSVFLVDLTVLLLNVGQFTS